MREQTNLSAYAPNCYNPYYQYCHVHNLRTHFKGVTYYKLSLFIHIFAGI